MFKCSRMRPIMVTALTLTVMSLAVIGCNSGSRDGFGSNIPGVTFSAQPLEVDHAIYLSDRMDTPRYSHTATLLDDGRVLVIGGSEDNHSEGLASAEVYDQAAFVDAPPLPETRSGVWFKNDFLGEPIEMDEARIMHTATLLPDGNVLVVGGVNDNVISSPLEAEVFDVQTRSFNEVEIDGTMVLPRFRHSATLMPNGKVLVVGGREVRSTTTIDQFGNTITTLSFPSTPELEEFDPVQLSFSRVEDFQGDNPELTSTTGRFGHAVTRVAGPDGSYNSSDDVLVVACGTRTLSGASAPATIRWGFGVGNAVVDSLEYYDPVSRTAQLAPAVVTTGRNNGVKALNLGEFTDGETPFGEEGVDNVFLVTHGDNDDFPQTSVNTDQVYAVTFIGVGPVGGISFSEVTSGGLGSYRMNAEHLLVPLPCLTLFNFGISFADPMMMSNQRIYGDTTYNANWAISISGVFLFVVQGQQAELYTGTGCPGNEIQGVRFFDPFWNVSNALGPQDLDGNPPPPWDLTQTESVQNPTGVVGTWILGHNTTATQGVPADPTDVPPNDPPLPYGKFAENFLTGVAPDEGRLWHTLTLLPGFDGVINTPDDRVLVTGGGESYVDLGGQARSRSTLVYLPPNASFNVPD